jgi:hypothetical protein
MGVFTPQPGVGLCAPRESARRSAAALALVLAAPVAAQDVPELITDRPDQTESAAVVPKGSVQLEVGWTFTRDDDDGVRVETHEVPGTLVRIGLAERFELRVGWTGYVSTEARFRNFDADADGAGDAELGAKVYFKEERGAAPEIALLLGTSVPVGDDDFTSDRYDPSFRLSFAHTLSDRLSLGYNLGMEWETGIADAGRRSTLSSYLYTVALGIGVSDRVGAFLELYGDVPGSAPGSTAHSFDGGFTFLVRDHLQVDLAGGVGLSDAADDWFVGVGLSVRWPR